MEVFIIEPKFKVNDLVEVVDDKNYCTPILNKICKIIKITKRLETSKPLYTIYSEDIVGVWYVEEDQIVPAYLEREYQRITDPSVNYEELFKEPVYIEFINIGEALSKLQMFENKEASDVVYEEPIGLKEAPDVEEIKVGDVVFIPGKYLGTKNVKCAVVKAVLKDRIEVQYPSDKTFTHNKYRVFKDYNKALESV